MRLIDADELKGAISKLLYPVVEESYTHGYNNGLKEVIDLIDNAPTVEPRIEYGTDGQPYRLFMSGGQIMPDTLQGWRYEEKPQGKWIKIFENPFTNGYICPFCSHKIQVTEQFLPEVTECEVCGAELKGGTE